MSLQMRTVFIACIALTTIMGCASLGIITSAEHEFEMGLSFFNRGQYDEAVPYFVRATELDAHYADAFIYLGRSHLNRARWPQAIPPLRTAYLLSPVRTQDEVLNSLIDALLGAAGSDFGQGNFQGAINYLKEGLKLDADSHKLASELVAVLIAQGSELLSQGRVDDAISSFGEAIRISPSQGDAYLGLARAFFREGNLFKARDDAEKAFRIDPSNPEMDFFRKGLGIRPGDLAQ
jgi:tetratricopeptide (TPR) repeat protein